MVTTAALLTQISLVRFQVAQPKFQFRCSTAVVHLTVNQRVGGSIPPAGAK